MSVFHAYDIRAKYPSELHEDLAYKIGFRLTEVVPATEVLVGYDCRLSSESLLQAFCNGIIDSGKEAHVLGLCSTPMLYYFTAELNYSASVMITASHNAPDYNGLKISGPQASPIAYDNGLQQLEELVKQPIVANANKGKLVELANQYENYLKFFAPYITESTDLKLAIDCSNGMANLYIKDLVKAETTYINDEIDGRFPAHHPNPLEAKNREDLKKLMDSGDFDLGFIFDGDADRVMLLDEKGEFISPDLLIAVLGKHFLKSGFDQPKVLQDIRSSKAIGEYLGDAVEMHTWKVGRAFASRKLREIDGLWGGELAGHYYFKDFNYNDSGMLACLLFIKIFSDYKKEGVSASQLIKSIQSNANSGELNYSIKENQQAMEAVRLHFENQKEASAFYDFDGYRMEYPDFWFNIRPSNTEDYLRLICEAKSEELLQQIINEIESILAPFKS